MRITAAPTDHLIVSWSPKPKDVDTAGALKIYIPPTGQIVRFEKHLVVDGTMSVACKYKG